MIGQKHKAKGAGEMAALLELFKDQDKYAEQLATFEAQQARLEELTGMHQTLQQTEKVKAEADALLESAKAAQADADAYAAKVTTGAEESAARIEQAARNMLDQAKADRDEAARLKGDLKLAHDDRETQLITREAAVAKREDAARRAETAIDNNKAHWQEVAKQITALVNE